eukprot:Skav212377  [mRNA]  locus=scaffold1983:152662:154377:+ [translate_table: standard]
MAKLEEVWQALREAQLEALAPELLRHGVRCMSDLHLKAAALLDSGIKQWQLEKLLAGPQRVETVATPARADLPVPFSGRRASLAAALAAGKPNERKRSLELLDSDVLAKSTNPTQDARVRTYLAICRVWDQEPWPLSVHSVRCFGASMKVGGYRSAAVYFQAVCSHQQRVLRTSVSSLIRCCIRDCVRSILRGLGVSKLKDSFDALKLGEIRTAAVDGPFDFGCDDHIKDMVIICTWYMLRESEMSQACLNHLSLVGDEAQLLIPIHKTDGYGKLSCRSLKCSCRLTMHRMCVWHAVERHLLRVHQHAALAARNSFPLFPTAEGAHASKAKFIAAIRRVIELTGTPLTRDDPNGRQLDRFSGHTLRVAGAQMLSRAGVALEHIQLLGRWSSQAVLRYTQDSALTVVPEITHVVAGSSSSSSLPSVPQVSVVTAPATPAPVVEAPVAAQQPDPSSPLFDEDKWNQLADLQHDMMALRQSLQKPAVSYVFRPRAKVLHMPCPYEADNAPNSWRTRCGCTYGNANFWRTSDCPSHLRKCRKCFGTEGASDSDDSSSSSKSGVVSTDGDSSSDSC